MDLDVEWSKSAVLLDPVRRSNEIPLARVPYVRRWFFARDIFNTLDPTESYGGIYARKKRHVYLFETGVCPIRAYGSPVTVLPVSGIL